MLVVLSCTPTRNGVWVSLIWKLVGFLSTLAKKQLWRWHCVDVQSQTWRAFSFSVWSLANLMDSACKNPKRSWKGMQVCDFQPPFQGARHESEGSTSTSWINQVTRWFHGKQKIYSDFLCSNLWPRGHESNIMTTDDSHRTWDGLLVSCRYWNHGGCLLKNKQKLVLCYFRRVLGGLVSASLHTNQPLSYFWQHCSGSFPLHSNSRHIPYSPHGHRKTLPCPKSETKIMASSPITSWQIDREKTETSRFYFLSSKITVDGSCRHEM